MSKGPVLQTSLDEMIINDVWEMHENSRPPLPLKKKFKKTWCINMYIYTHNNHISDYSWKIISNICFISPMGTFDKPSVPGCVSEKMITVLVHRLSHKKNSTK